jgi:hypothetical protein
LLQCQQIGDAARQGEIPKSNNKGETSMTTLILRATPFIEMVVPKLQGLYVRFLHALDAFAEVKMRKAVPERYLRKAQREVNRYHRMLHLDRTAKTKSFHTR